MINNNGSKRICNRANANTHLLLYTILPQALEQGHSFKVEAM